jgi:hypothetical protein
VRQIHRKRRELTATAQRSKISIIDFRPDQNTHICNEVIHMTLMTALLQLAVFIVDPVLS